LISHAASLAPPPRRRIAVVEDDADVREELDEALEDAGYEVTTYRDGADALAGMRRAADAPDLIVLDLRMPVMNGWEFRTKQKADPALAGVPVLAISADSGPQAAAFDAPIVLAKPFSIDSLLGCVEQIFAHAAGQRDRRRGETQAARLAALGTLAAGIAHEINNPLASLIANIESAREALPPASGDVGEMLADALEAAQRIPHIAHDISAFARAEDRDGTCVGIEGLIDSALRLLGHQLRQTARIARARGDPPEVRGGEGKLVQVVMNLVLNAAQAIPETGGADAVVRIATRRSFLGECVLEVSDSGVGISAENLGKIFDPFFTTKAAGKGTGLGLSICQDIVASLGGKIEVESRLGHGSTFRVTLPAATPAIVSTAPGPQPGRKRILIVDVAVDLVRSLLRALDPPHEVTIATSGQQAVEALSAEAYDLVLCQLLMPKKSGVELYREIAALRPGSERRFVFLTDEAPTGAYARFLREVPNRYLRVPFDVEDLKALVGVLCR
jgi:signal transduction histidine kinase